MSMVTISKSLSLLSFRSNGQTHIEYSLLGDGEPLGGGDSMIYNPAAKQFERRREVNEVLTVVDSFAVSDAIHAKLVALFAEIQAAMSVL